MIGMYNWLWSYFFNTSKREPTEEEIVKNEGLDESVGKITIRLGEGGDFSILSTLNIDGDTDDVILTVSQLLYFMSKGAINSYLYDSLILWAGTDENRMALISQIASNLEEMMVEAKRSSMDSPVVSPSDVFLYKDPRERH